MKTFNSVIFELSHENMRAQDHEALFHLLMKLLITEYCKIKYPEISDLVSKAEYRGGPDPDPVVNITTNSNHSG